VFVEIAEKHYDRLFAYCNAILLDGNKAEDACQDVLLKLLTRFQDGDKRCRDLAWILTVARNHCYDMIRKERRIVDSDCTEHQLESVYKGPEEELLRNEEVLSIRNQLKSMPPKYREVLVLRDFNDMSYKDIAAHLNCNVSRVKWMLNTARSRLRLCLGDRYE
jgi:RNA polymerase sigma-70 factor (ECF subfamily)